jgi:2-amino-4-hydroxy-6-hydroxymethyldihydropteridine diphosphokinase
MAAALRMLDADPQTGVVAVSSLYRTPPWGKTDQPDFLNAAAELSTRLSPHALLELCLEAERRLKRVREERWGPRLIDIDILTFGDRTIHEAGLDVPHPRMLERAFVLVPLAEIAPDLVVGGSTVAERLAAMDTAGIEKLPGGSGWWGGQAG